MSVHRGLWFCNGHYVGASGLVRRSIGACGFVKGITSVHRGLYVGASGLVAL
jgi:hypothetical protein